MHHFSHIKAYNEDLMYLPGNYFKNWKMYRDLSQDERLPKIKRKQ